MLDRTILLDGFSKTYAMTGWRCGYAAMPEALVEPLTRLFVNSTRAAAFVQKAGVAALTGPQDAVTAMVAEFAAAATSSSTGLNALPGVSCRSPRGRVLRFPNVAGHRSAPTSWPTRLLEEAGVALLAGTAFGARARPPAPVLRELQANLTRALERMDTFLRAL